jgi:hypothetical protein
VAINSITLPNPEIPVFTIGPIGFTMIKGKPIIVNLIGPIVNRKRFGLGWFMVLNATFNNILVISWRSVLLVEETREPRENHQPVASP